MADWLSLTESERASLRLHDHEFLYVAAGTLADRFNVDADVFHPPAAGRPCRPARVVIPALEALLNAGWTLADIADEVLCHPKTLQGWRDGRRPVPAGAADRLAAIAWPADQVVNLFPGGR